MIKINEENAEVILKHYNAIPILIRYIKQQKDGWKTLQEWDHARDSDKPIKMKITIIEE